MKYLTLVFEENDVYETVIVEINPDETLGSVRNKAIIKRKERYPIKEDDKIKCYLSIDSLEHIMNLCLNLKSNIKIIELENGKKVNEFMIINNKLSKISKVLATYNS